MVPFDKRFSIFSLAVSTQGRIRSVGSCSIVGRDLKEKGVTYVWTWKCVYLYTYIYIYGFETASNWKGKPLGVFSTIVNLTAFAELAQASARARPMSVEGAAPLPCVITFPFSIARRKEVSHPELRTASCSRLLFSSAASAGEFTCPVAIAFAAFNRYSPCLAAPHAAKNGDTLNNLIHPSNSYDVSEGSVRSCRSQDSEADGARLQRFCRVVYSYTGRFVRNSYTCVDTGWHIYTDNVRDKHANTFIYRSARVNTDTNTKDVCICILLWARSSVDPL